MSDLRADVRAWLAEDVGPGDLTTIACVPASTAAVGRLTARQKGVVAGLEAARRVFAELDPSLAWQAELADGDSVAMGGVIATVSGLARPILTGERLALNLLQRLSGIATLTRRFVESAGGVAVLDTRKTTPGLRALEKAAVRAGGGRNHRFGLYDGILIKDNHIAAAGGVRQAVEAARRLAPHTLVIEVEVDTLGQLDEAIAAGAGAVLLDNMPAWVLREAVARVPEGIFVEASGGITAETVGALAATGVQAVSVGALTHSAPALDIGLDLTLAG